MDDVKLSAKMRDFDIVIGVDSNWQFHVIKDRFGFPLKPERPMAFERIVQFLAKRLASAAVMAAAGKALARRGKRVYDDRARANGEMISSRRR